MADQESFREQVRQLLAQDPEVNSETLKEFRMKLESNLAGWEHKSQRIRRVLAATAVTYFVLYLMAIFFLPRFDEARRLMPDSWLYYVYAGIAKAWVLAAVLSFVVGFYALYLYLFKYAPGLKRARFDVQTTMLLELQEQVAQLRQEIRSSGK
jgi:hypothetical protein